MSEDAESQHPSVNEVLFLLCLSRLSVKTTVSDPPQNLYYTHLSQDSQTRNTKTVESTDIVMFPKKKRDIYVE